MHPLKQLRKMMKESTPGQGKVVKVGDSIQVATHQGPLTITPQTNDATTYRVGDSVILSNGMIVGRRLKTPTTYVI